MSRGQGHLHGVRRGERRSGARTAAVARIGRAKGRRHPRGRTRRPRLHGRSPAPERPARTERGTQHARDGDDQGRRRRRGQGRADARRCSRRWSAYNEQLVNAGIMLGGEGLKPSSAGAKVRFRRAGDSVVDGPFTESKEVIAGYWIWEVSSLAEAVEWAKRCPSTRVRRAPRCSRSGRCSTWRTSPRRRRRDARQKGGSCRATRPSRRLTDGPDRSVEALWRIESPQLIATLARRIGDVGSRRGPRSGGVRGGARAVAARRRAA